MANVAGIRARHVREATRPFCALDHQGWPCDAVILLDIVDAHADRDEWHRKAVDRAVDADRLAAALRDLTHAETCQHHWCQSGRAALAAHEASRG